MALPSESIFCMSPSFSPQTIISSSVLSGTYRLRLESCSRDSHRQFLYYGKLSYLACARYQLHNQIYYTNKNTCAQFSCAQVLKDKKRKVLETDLSGTAARIPIAAGAPVDVEPTIVIPVHAHGTAIGINRS